MIQEDITIILVTYNSENVIESCLSLLPRDMKIIVLDNGSTDGTVAKLAGYPFVEVIKNHNIGYGKAANIGLSKVTTPYGLLLNPDVKVRPDTLSILAASLKKDPKLAVVSAIMCHEENGNKETCKKYFFDENGLYYTDWIVGALMLFDMKALRDVGMFDENIFLFFEETDLCSRFIEHGYRLAICKGAIAEHNWGTSSASSLRTTKIRAWHSAWARAYYYKKHRGLAVSLMKSVCKLFKNIINVPKSLLLGRDPMLIKNGYEIMGLIAFFLGIKAYRKDGTARIA